MAAKSTKPSLPSLSLWKEEEQDDDFEFKGDSLNYLAFAINLVLTSAAMLLPKRAYDEAWVEVGFCVDKREDRAVDTGILCFVVLTTGAIGLFFLYQSKKSTLNKLAQRQMEGRIFSNFSHGFGHLFLQFTGGSVPPLEFSLEFHAIAWIITLLLFFVGVFRAVTVSTSNGQALVMAISAILLQYMLDVPPDMSFTYSQAVILATGSFDQILLPSKDKQNIAYLANALYSFPLYGLYYLESTRCSDLLLQFGGHVLYDLYLAAAPFIFYYAIQRHESDQKAKTA